MALIPDTENVEDNGSGFDVIPKGNYKVVIEETVQVETKNGDPMLKLTAVVIEGPYEGRKIFDSLLLDHPNEDARNIGLRKLKQLKVAVGKPQSREETDLWDTPVMANVGIQVDKTGQYSDQNRINGFKPIAVQAAAAPARTQATATPPPGEGSAKRSWRK